MEKITKQLRWLLASLMLVVGVSSAWADDVYSTCLFGASYNSQSVNGYTDKWTATNEGFTWSISNGNNNQNNWSFVRFGRKNVESVGSIITSAAYSEAITKVEVTIDALTASKVNSIKLYTSTDNSSWTEANSFSKTTGTQSVSLASPTKNLYYKIEFDCASGSSNGLITVSKVEYYYNPSGTVSPSISADDVSVEYNATSGSIEYTINNPVTGGSLSASTTAEWLTIGTVGTNVPFTCEANENGERTATVVLTYAYGSESVTKNVIVTQAGNPNGPGTENNPYTVAQARDAIDADTGLTGVYVTGIVSQVDSYNSQYKSITYWISDDGTTTNQLEVYSGKGLNGANFSAVDNVQVGATVVVFGTLKKYNDIYEFDKNNYLNSYTAPAVSVEAPTFSPASGKTFGNEGLSVTLSQADGKTIYYTLDGSDPDNTSTQYSGAINLTTTTTIKAIAYDGSDASSIVSATYTYVDPNGPGTENNPYTVAQARAAIDAGTGTSDVYATGIVSAIPTAWSTQHQNITFNFVDNDGDSDYLQAYRCVSTTDANASTIAVGDIVVVKGNLTKYNNTTYEFGAGCQLVSLTHPAVAVEAPTFSPAAGTYSEAQDVTITCATEGATIYYTTDGTTPDANSSEYTDAINVSTTTTIKAIAYNGDAKSEVAEATYTIDETPVTDYAELSFKFDGGREDIENTPGLTQNGLDSDYSASPKLKFNSTGDAVILKINERPGTLTFDIKGNSFSGGTFKVQTSVDGETYTDLETYTELGSTQNESFDNLGENVRYIKWIYTEKSSGNVALGNITLAKYEEDTRIDTQTTFEQDAYEITHGDPFTAPTATLNPSDAGDLKYSSSMTSVATVDENTGAVSILTSGTTIITAKFLGNETYKPSEASYTLTVNTPETAPTFTLITSADEFDDGDYIIVYEGVAMNTTVSSNRLQYTKVTPENNVIRTDNASIIWHIAKSGDYYTIYNADANEYAASTGSGNQTTMLEDGTDDKALWSVTPGETFDFTNKYNSDKWINANLRRNGTYGFACYATGTGGPLSLYRKDGTHARIATTISFSQSGPFSVDFGDDFTAPTATLTPADAGSLVYSSSDENVATVDATTGEVSIVNTGTCLITAEFVGNENYKPSNQSYQLTVNPKLNPKNIGSEYYVKVTSIDQIENGDAVIIVYEYGNVAMNTTQNPDNRTAVTIVKNNGTIQLTNGTGGTLNNIPVTEKLILVKDGDYYHFYASRGTNNGFLYMAGYNTEDFLRTQETLNGNSKAAVSIDSNSNANIVFQGDRTGTGFHNTLYWDPISNVFSCYLPNKELMEPIQLYVEVEKGATETVELVDAQDCYKTMAAPYNMDLTGSDLKAYIVTLNDEQNEAEFVPVTKIPAGTPIVLHSETAGTYELTKAGSNFTADDVVADNELKESDGSVTGDASTIYVLNKNPEIGFYLLNSGKTLAEGKCYLQIEKGNGAKFIGFHFEGEATGIAGLESANDKLQGTIYNLAGQRVTTPAHGLYIVNGKKVFIK